MKLFIIIFINIIVLCIDINFWIYNILITLLHFTDLDYVYEVIIIVFLNSDGLETRNLTNNYVYSVRFLAFTDLGYISLGIIRIKLYLHKEKYMEMATWMSRY